MREAFESMIWRCPAPTRVPKWQYLQNSIENLQKSAKLRQKCRKSPRLPGLEIEIHILQKVYVTQTQNSKGREGGGVAKRPQLKFEICFETMQKKETKNEKEKRKKDIE